MSEPNVPWAEIPPNKDSDSDKDDSDKDYPDFIENANCCPRCEKKLPPQSSCIDVAPIPRSCECGWQELR